MNASTLRPHRVVHVGTPDVRPEPRVVAVGPSPEPTGLIVPPDPSSPEVLTMRLEALLRAAWESRATLEALGPALESFRRCVPAGAQAQGRAVALAANAVKRRLRELGQ